MTTKQQAEICVNRGLTDDEIVAMTGCHPECAEVVRAWGRGEKVEIFNTLDRLWHTLFIRNSYDFSNPDRVRIAPRLIRATAELPDGRTVEVEWPEPVREPPEDGQTCWRSDLDLDPVHVGWNTGRACDKWFRQGRIHLTREAALQHDRAMIKLNGGEVE